MTRLVKKEREGKDRMKPFIDQYAGPRSRRFWQRLNAAGARLPERAYTRLYRLGCRLQNMEHRVLRAVEEAEARVRKRGKETSHDHPER